MTSIDRRDWLCWLAASLAASRSSAPPGARGGPPHAALHLYTRPLLSPHHEPVVRMALAQRSRVHTSGWEQRGGKPVVALGPVQGNAGHFHGETMTSAIARAWPFAAVLEYESAGGPLAFIDWFRRSRDNRDPGGWLLDPTMGYMEHINAAVVFHKDERWSYMALVDTPTLGVLGAQEFAIRARVRWTDGRRVQKGWWTRLIAPAERDKSAWYAETTPLVDWYVDAETLGQGAVGIAAVPNPERELAVWGTGTVFRFPEIPVGMRPGR